MSPLLFLLALSVAAGSTVVLYVRPGPALGGDCLSPSTACLCSDLQSVMLALPTSTPLSVFVLPGAYASTCLPVSFFFLPVLCCLWMDRSHR
jgi:hypothetical protein